MEKVYLLLIQKLKSETWVATRGFRRRQITFLSCLLDGNAPGGRPNVLSGHRCCHVHVHVSYVCTVCSWGCLGVHRHPTSTIYRPLTSTHVLHVHLEWLFVCIVHSCWTPQLEQTLYNVCTYVLIHTCVHNLPSLARHLGGSAFWVCRLGVPEQALGGFP